MRFGKIGIGLFIGSVLLVLPGLAQTQVEEHWSPYTYPTEIPEGVPHHLVTEGDTLWALAGQYLGDPLLWPQLYQLNSYIEDPDLIYPGDPILMNVGVIVDNTSIAGSLDGQQDVGSEDGEPGAAGDDDGRYENVQEFAEASDDDTEQADGEEGDVSVGDRAETVFDDDGMDTEFVILPAGSRSDMECSTYLYAQEKPGDDLPFDLVIAGSENRFLTQFSFGDILYLSRGYAAGVQPGEVYSVRRPLRKVFHPDTKGGLKVNNGRRYMGMAVDQVGIVKIVAVQEKNATALVTGNCQDLRVGDFLVPYEQEPIPLITELPIIDRWKEFRTEGRGTIVLAENEVISFGQGHLCNVDLGIDKNVAPGDLFIIFRENPNNLPKKGLVLPDVYLGYGVALKVANGTTVMKVIQTNTNIQVGDRVIPYASQNTSF